MYKNKKLHDLKISPPLNPTEPNSPPMNSPPFNLRPIDSSLLNSSSIDSPSKYSPFRKSIFSCLVNFTPNFLKYFNFNSNLKNRFRSAEICDDDLITITDLGSGVSGTVFKVEHKETSIIMAKKVIKLETNEKIKKQILRELKTLGECDSPYIIGFYGAYSLNNNISICTEYMDGGSLDLVMKKINRIPECALGKISLSVLNGLKYLREKHGIIHRDIKPSNMLINCKGEIKLCDLGVSGQLINSIANTFIGTCFYMSPERLEGKDYSIQSDIWSLGISIVEMALGFFPIPMISDEIIEKLFEIDYFELPAKISYKSAQLSVFELLEYIVNEPPPCLPGKYFGESIVDFTSQCLVKDQFTRSNLQLLVNHSFCQKKENEKAYLEWYKKLTNLGLI